MTKLPWNIALDERWEIYSKDKTLFYLWPKLSSCDVVPAFKDAIAALNGSGAYRGPNFRMKKEALHYDVFLGNELVAEFSHVGSDQEDLQVVCRLLEGAH